MKLYDQHLHSCLSSDSSEGIEKYLAKAQQLGLTHFVTTEHMDLSCLLMGTDDIPDFDKQEKLLKKYRKQYDMQILKGVEVGYKYSRLHDIERIVETRQFDVVIMSVHESEDAPCTEPGFLKNLSTDEAYSAYLDIYIHMLMHCDCFDIVGHIDFLLRYIGKVSIKKHEEKLKTLFSLIIAKNKSLEFNTRFLYQQRNNNYLIALFTLYYACGGRKLSLGSDAHTAHVFLGGFDEAISIIKEIGFTHITTFQQRQETALIL